MAAQGSEEMAAALTSDNASNTAMRRTPKKAVSFMAAGRNVGIGCREASGNTSLYVCSGDPILRCLSFGKQ